MGGSPVFVGIFLSSRCDSPIPLIPICQPVSLKKMSRRGSGMAKPVVERLFLNGSLPDLVLPVIRLNTVIPFPYRRRREANGLERYRSVCTPGRGAEPGDWPGPEGAHTRFLEALY